MTDVFLSYSRKDTDSVKELFDSLGARNREIWIDLHGIEYSSKWWDEICAGIEGADNFVLIVSQNSLESLFCHREINHALKHNKRIIPFLITPVDEKAMFRTWQNDPELCKYEQLTRENWESIRSIQWIDFTQIKDIEKGVDALLETVDTDPERVKLHTRLLLRMRDWEGTGRNPSGLLRGDELALYEKWFTDSRQKETPPHPTEEQVAYIVESLRVQDELETKRIQRERLVKRFRVASVTLGLFFTIAVVAIFMSILREAKTNVLVAAGNTQLAYAGETLTPVAPTLTSVAQTVVAGGFMIEAQNLTAHANTILQTSGGNAETAALLSIRVLRKLYLPSADTTLNEAISRLKATSFVIPFTYYLSRVSFSPDGKTFVIAASDNIAGVIELRDSSTGNVLWVDNFNYSLINDVAFSPDGNMIGFAASNKTAVILDTASGKQIGILNGHSDAVMHVAFSPDNKNVLTVGTGSDSTFRLWDVETGKQIYSVPSSGDFSKIYFFPGGQLVFAGNSVHNLSNGSQNNSWKIGGAVLAVSPDGKTYITGLSTTATLINTITGQKIRSFSGHTGSVMSAAFSGDGKWLVTGGDDNSSRLWEVATGKQVMLLSGITNNRPSVAFSPDGAQMLTGSDTVRLWNIVTEDQQLNFSVSTSITKSALSPDGKSILIGDESGHTSLWDLNTGNLLHSFPKDYHDVKSLAFSPDGKMVAIPLGYKDTLDGVDINLYDSSTGTLIKKIAIKSSDPIVHTLTFSSDGKMLLATLGDNKSRLFDITSGKLLRAVTGQSQLTVISPDGNLVSINSGSKWFDISSGKEVEFSGIMYGDRLFFSPDGSLLASGNPDGSIFVWDFKAKTLVATISGHTGAITSLAFSPDNGLLLSGSTDYTARLWDLSTGQQVRVFSGHKAAVTGVGFILNGKKVVTSSMDKTIRTWFTDYNDLVSYACTLVGTDIEYGEREQYGFSDIDMTCEHFGKLLESFLPTATPLPTFTPLPVWTPIPTPTP